MRLLWVTPNLPRRGVAAARERWWALLQRLAQRHQIALLAFVDQEDVGAEGELPPGLSAVHLVRREPWSPEDPMALLPRTVRGAFVHPALGAAVRECIARERYDLVQFEYVEMGYLMPSPKLPTVLTVHQLGFASHGREWRAAGRPLRRLPVAVFRYLRDLDFELRAVCRAHHIVTVSAEDAARLRYFWPELPISVSPCGVDTRQFSPVARAPGGDPNVVFVGNFAHPPNVDGAIFLVREVLPQLGRPVRVRIIGHGVTSDLAALAHPEAVDVVGAVPDVRPFLADAAVVVAPVRFGTGMRGKVLEALAMGRPVVTTSVGAEGLGAVAGRHVEIADGAAAFAAAVRRVLEDEGLARRLGQAGRDLVTERFDWDAIAAAHDDIYREVLARVRDTARVTPQPGGSRLGRLAATLGPRAAVAAGAAVLALRGLRWYGRARRPRFRVHRPGSTLHAPAARSPL